MHRFEYRLPRTATSFSVDFILDGEIFRGLCRDVSEEGVRAKFDGILSVGVTGMLVLRHPSSVIKQQARVAYVEQDQVGLAFLFDAAHEREIVLRLLSLIAEEARREAD